MHLKPNSLSTHRVFPQTSSNQDKTEQPMAQVSIKMHFINQAAYLYKHELVVFLSLKSQSLPSVSSMCRSLRDFLGYSPFSPHTLSSEATCSPVYPTRLSRCLISQFLRCVCAHLSLVSTSKQKRLSMDSVFRRMQDFRVSCVGPCRGRDKVGEVVCLCDQDDDGRKSNLRK